MCWWWWILGLIKLNFLEAINPEVPQSKIIGVLWKLIIDYTSGSNN